MNRFLLTMAVTLFSAAQISTAQGSLVGLRTAYPRLLAKTQAQELAAIELDWLSAEVLQKFSVVVDGVPVSPPSLGRALSPLTQARVMLHERETLLAALQQSHYEVRESLRKIIKLAGDANANIVLRRDDGIIEQVLLNRLNFSEAADYLTENMLARLDRPPLSIMGSKNRLGSIRLSSMLEMHGISTRPLLQRVEEREKNGRRDIAHVLRELGEAGNDPYPTALVHMRAKDTGFSVQIEAFTTPWVEEASLAPEAMADDLTIFAAAQQEMVLPGIETKVALYELAARIAAANFDTEALRANLRRILALNNSTDQIQMTVSLRDELVVLGLDTLHTVQQLYLRVFATGELSYHWGVCNEWTFPTCAASVF